MIDAEGGEGEGGGEELGVGGRDEELLGIDAGEDAVGFELDGVDAPVDTLVLSHDAADAGGEGLGEADEAGEE